MGSGAVKVYFFGGKGGVGKTSISSAFALFLSRLGRKVLLISTDPAHSLTDIFGVSFSEGEVKENLHIIQIEPSRAIKEYIDRALDTVSRLFGTEEEREIKSIFKDIEYTPGVEDAVIVETLSKVILSNWDRYSYFVVDTAPTGHTLYMVKTVARVGVWLEELIRRRSRADRFLESAGKGREDKVLGILRERRERFSKFASLLFSDKVIFIPVLNPERLSIEETHRLVKEIRALGMKVNTLVVNKVLPEHTTDPFLRERKKQEKEYLSEIRRRFRDLKIVEVPLKEKDIKGIGALKELAEELKLLSL